MDAPDTAVIDEVRAFNRFYTRAIGLLAEHLPASDLSLPAARVLYELAQGGEPAAADLVRRLRMDRAHLSRILARFRARGLVRGRRSPEHGRRQLLVLTAAGRRAFAALEQGTRGAIGAMVGPIGPPGRRRLVAAMQEIRGLFGEPKSPPQVRLRGLVPGDVGWIVHRQAVLYHREYGWDWTYEGLIADILGHFISGFDPAHEDAWVAERAGEMVGSVFLVKGDSPDVAKLRLLYVEPSARGAGIGRMLVAACIARARELGYGRLVLWTNDVLVSARRIYQAAGFRLVGESRHHSFGKDLTGQTWSLEL
ncbi:MAG TPA: bifunctional helix-turn-helix transcriptional regulator/GNAT family N-acetyltransferase [Steroidobacteraceae bacterium]|nr:bifunctional helix-turn-helix transcriptional regulator/GNAT family N-acetyltransferase [Steroidobacteraceae bacterium]